MDAMQIHHQTDARDAAVISRKKLIRPILNWSSGKVGLADSYHCKPIATVSILVIII